MFLSTKNNDELYKILFKICYFKQIYFVLFVCLYERLQQGCLLYLLYIFLTLYLYHSLSKDLLKTVTLQVPNYIFGLHFAMFLNFAFGFRPAILWTRVKFLNAGI